MRRSLTGETRWLEHGWTAGEDKKHHKGALGQLVRERKKLWERRPNEVRGEKKKELPEGKKMTASGGSGLTGL